MFKSLIMSFMQKNKMWFALVYIFQFTIKFILNVSLVAVVFCAVFFLNLQASM